MKFRKIDFIEFESKNIFTKNVFMIIVMFITVMIAYNALLTPGILFLTINNITSNPDINPASFSGATEMAQLPNIQIYSLFATGLGILVALLYVKFIERRSFHSTGIVKKGFATQYGIGYLIGILMIGLPAMAVVLYSGSIEMNSNPNLLLLIIYFLGFLMQGASEEIMFRGYLMTSLAKAKNIFWAIIISSIIFAVAHSLNPNMSWLPALNLFLYGVFAALIFLRTKNIWLVSALHSAWNYFQGNIFGIQVSGQVFGGSLMNITSKSPEILSGGDFGLEGGLFVTALLIGASIIVLFIGENKLMIDSMIAEEGEETA
ncbi:MAG: type II CAAX endopeptidase family protein [Eubacteriales bacterium]